MAAILYVDDEDINLRLFQINFGKEHTIVTAHSGNEGLEVLTQERDLSMVLCDLKMPFMNGIDFCSKAKKIRPALPFLLLTGSGITEEVQSAIEKGIVLQILKKPFDLQELTDAIRKFG